MKIITFFLTLLILSSCAQFSQKDIASMKKVAIVTSMEDKLFLNGTGLTALENSSSYADISSWKLVDRILNQVAATAKAKHPQIEFTVMDRNKYPYIPDYGSGAKISAQMRNEGFDAVLLITNAGVYSSNTGSQMVSTKNAGFIVLEKSFFGKELATFICAQYRLDLVKTENGNFLKYATTSDIYGQKTFNLKLKSFEQYTQDEREIIKNALVNHIDTTTEKNTTEVFTPTDN